jgi:hypothetical protein
MNDELQVRELLATAAELPDEVRPPVASLLQRSRRRRARRTRLVTATAAVAVVAAAGLPAAIHAAETAPYRPGGGRALAGLFGPLPASTGPAATMIAGFRWSRLPPSPLGGRSQPIVAWTGRELLELAEIRNGATIESGAAFSPATGRWHLIAGTGQRNIGFTNAVSVWTGRQLFVTDGQVQSCAIVGSAAARCGPQAGLYDPAANRWTQTRLPAAMEGLDLTAAIWTGRDVILAGANSSRGRLGVAAYDPATGRWRMITPVLPAGHPVEDLAMTATASRLFLWSMWTRVHTSSAGPGGQSGVDVLSLGADGIWRDVTGRWPQRVTVTAPLSTSTAILVPPGQVWCGNLCSPPYTSFPGYFADPVTLARTGIPAGPLGNLDPAFVWTGRAVIAVNEDASVGTGSSHLTVGPGDMALFDPGTRRWQRLPTPPGYPRLSAVLPVWAGTELLAITARGQLLALHG